MPSVRTSKSYGRRERYLTSLSVPSLWWKEKPIDSKLGPTHTSMTNTALLGFLIVHPSQ